jgi:hypothetical protein
VVMSNNRLETIISFDRSHFNVILSRSLGSCHIFYCNGGKSGKRWFWMKSGRVEVKRKKKPLHKRHSALVNSKSYSTYPCYKILKS